MGVDIEIPQPFRAQLVGPISVNAALQPATVDLNLGGVMGQPLIVDLGLDDVAVELSGNPKQPLNVDLGLDRVNANVSVAVTKLPPIRLHLPMNYELGFGFLGIQLFNFTLRGKTMVLSDDALAANAQGPAPVVISLNEGGG